jgi:hypothetical protein
MKGKGTTLKNFHQVDKQALLMDLIGAFQAHTDHFITHKLSSDAVTRSVAVSTAGVDRSSAENESGSATISTGDASNGKSGNILLKGGDGYQTGNIDVMIGHGVELAGTLKLSGGSSSSGVGGHAQFYAGSSESGSGGSVIVGGGSSILQKGGDALFGSGSSETGSGGETAVTSGSGPESGGSMTIESGSSAYKGGSLNLLAGDAASERDALGGSIKIESGSSANSNSGTVAVESGPEGVSGSMSLGTGSSTVDTSGSMAISTGLSSAGSSGIMMLTVGEAKGGEGGALEMSSGTTTSSSSIDHEEMSTQARPTPDQEGTVHYRQVQEVRLVVLSLP